MTTLAGPSRPAAAARGFWPMRDLPVVVWLAATVVVALFHAFLPAPRWLLIHLTLLGAATHAILVWSRYFADALLHSPTSAGDRTDQDRRLVLLDAGVLVVLAGVTSTVWALTVVGATAVVVAVAWHGLTLAQRLRRALGSRFAVTVRYYVAAACLLPAGVAIGVALARVQADPWHARLVVAHASVNLFGWIGLTALGTLVTLWPTILRTRIAAGAETVARRALPLLVTSVAVVATGALADQRWLAALGLAGYLAGVLVLARPFVTAARTRAPYSFPAASVLAAVCWLTGSLAVLAPRVATSGTWAEAGERFTAVTPYLAAGFGAQLLLGALSWLVPVALGGGPTAVAAASASLGRAGLLRVATVNSGLLACALPVPPAARVLCSAVVLVAMASFLPLLVLGIRASLRVRRGAPASVSPSREKRAPRPLLAVAVGATTVLVAALAGVAVERGTSLLQDGGPVAGGVTPTGHTTTVAVEAKDMRFTPSRISVPAGDRLVIELTNTDDEDVHDLVLDDGRGTARLSPGESERLEVGVVGRDVAGWCSVIGHHRMGMALTIEAVGATGAGSDSPASSPEGHDLHSQHGHDDPSATAEDAPPAVAAHDPVLPPVPPGRVHRRTFTVKDVVREVAPGVTQRMWTFDGTVPGPTLHGRVGDVFEITLVNDGSIGHSIDFHAGALAPDEVTRTIAPGGRLVYRFRADRAGIWMYHCSSMPMSAHIANGLFGAVVIDPPGLPPVDRTYVLSQSELYLGPDGGEVDLDKVVAETPDLVVFNGYADQYDEHPLEVRVGERVRVWLLDAGPNRSTSFHVVGAQFDATYAEGAWLLRPGTDGGAQSLALGPAQGGFVELSFPEPGTYPFVSHVMVDAERGAHGTFRVTR